MKKTAEEIQKLKESWLKDPCWDIEYEEGFEEHEAELHVFHKEQSAKWDEERLVKKLERAQKVGTWTGIYDVDLAQCLSTFEEISNDIDRGNVETALAQATLLLAAQAKRIADALEARNESDEADSNLEFMTKLYKVD